MKHIPIPTHLCLSPLSTTPLFCAFTLRGRFPDLCWDRELGWSTSALFPPKQVFQRQTSNWILWKLCHFKVLWSFYFITSINQPSLVWWCFCSLLASGICLHKCHLWQPRMNECLIGLTNFIEGDFHHYSFCYSVLKGKGALGNVRSGLRIWSRIEP